MFFLLANILTLLFCALMPTFKRSLAIENLLLKTQLAILKRQSGIKKIHTKPHERKMVALLLTKCKNTINSLKILSPETVLQYVRKFIQKKWTYPKKKKGRPTISAGIKALVFKLKKENHFASPRKIADTLTNMGFNISRESVRKILTTFRKQGKIKPGLTWNKFITAHIESLFACDFLTVDTILGKRFFVFIIIQIKTRQILKWGITQHPTRHFVAAQIEDFRADFTGECHLIHDNGKELCAVDYSYFDIQAHRTSIKAPNMNAHIERFIRTLRNELLDWFIILSKHQLQNIIKKYITYYNHYRPHQGLRGKIPDPKYECKKGQIKQFKVLYGLHNAYYRSVA